MKADAERTKVRQSQIFVNVWLFKGRPYSTPHLFQIKNGGGEMSSTGEVTHGCFSIAGRIGDHYRCDRRHCAVKRPEKTISMNSLLLEIAKEENFFFDTGRAEQLGVVE